MDFRFEDVNVLKLIASIQEFNMNLDTLGPTDGPIQVIPAAYSSEMMVTYYLKLSACPHRTTVTIPSRIVPQSASISGLGSRNPQIIRAVQFDPI